MMPPSQFGGMDPGKGEPHLEGFRPSGALNSKRDPQHGSCPSCRHVFSSVRPPSDSDNESSDGDYVPGDDEEDDEDDGFFDSDGFMDTESEFDDMDIQENLFGAPQSLSEFDGDVDLDAVLWEEEAANVSMEDSNWGLSDGASDSLSEVEGLAFSGELPENDGEWWLTLNHHDLPNHDVQMRRFTVIEARALELSKLLRIGLFRRSNRLARTCADIGTHMFIPPFVHFGLL